MVKNPPTSLGDTGSIRGSGSSSGEGNGNPLQHSCLGNPMHRGAWWATVPGVTKLAMTTAAAAAAKSLQSCPTLCDPAAHQAPPSLGLSRQEHWSGLPFPSPMHESEK